MDKTTDPEDGKAVAASIFIAVAVYAVRLMQSNHSVDVYLLMTPVGLLYILRISSFPPYPPKQEGSNLTAMSRTYHGQRWISLGMVSASNMMLAFHGLDDVFSRTVAL